MAVLTKTGMENILKRIMESGGLTESMEQDIQRLRDDFDEREGVLREYGETYDGEDLEEYEWKPKAPEDGTLKPEDENDWEMKYRELKKKYVDRFFEEKKEEIMEETTEDVKRDGEVQTFDELLTRTEG